MVNTRQDSTRQDRILARKLNKFLPLSADELKCLAEMQSAPVSLSRRKVRD